MPPFSALLVATLVLHMLFVQYVFAGSAYLASGHFMGPRRCAVCGWQAILLFWLPVAMGLAIATGVSALALIWLLYSEPLTAAARLHGNRQLLIVPVLIGCFGLLMLQKSAWITRRSWFWRIPVAAGAFAGLGFVAFRWTETHLLTLGEGRAASAVWTQLGVTFFASFTTLAVALAWQGRRLGMRLDQPPALAEVVVGLSPVRRLALTAVSGVTGVVLLRMLVDPGPPDGVRGLLTGPAGGFWGIAAGLGLVIQAGCWIMAALRDRLTTRILLVATAACLITLTSGVVLRETVRRVSLTQPRQADVTKLGPHWPAGMQLQGEHA